MVTHYENQMMDEQQRMYENCQWRLDFWDLVTQEMMIEDWRNLLMQQDENEFKQQHLYGPYDNVEY